VNKKGLNKPKLICHPNRCREGLIDALKMGQQLEFASQDTIISLSQELSCDSDIVIVVERTELITDIVAINYAFASQYDLLFVNGTEDYNQRWALQDRFNSVCMSIGSEVGSASDEFADLYDLIRSVFDFPAIEKKYKKALVIFQSYPFGILIESIPCAHMFHLQSDLRLLDGIVHSAVKRPAPCSKPIYFFVDSTDDKLTSEIPEIQNLLESQSHLEFHLRNKDATVENFRRYMEFLPFDVLFVTGHGSSPACHDVTYDFKDIRGNSHSMRVLEYYQFGESIGDLIAVQTFQEFLSIDGIPYKESELIAAKGLDHLKRDFVNDDNLKVLSAVELEPDTILGLKLSNGVFIGDVRSYAELNDSIIILNTCGSLLETSQMLSFSGARCLIGTMWSVSDLEARKFALELFNQGIETDMLSAFHYARSKLGRSRSGISYIYFGGVLDSFPNCPDEDSETEKALAQRLAAGIIKASTYVEHKLIRQEELDRFKTFPGLFGSAVDALLDLTKQPNVAE